MLGSRPTDASMLPAAARANGVPRPAKPARQTCRSGARGARSSPAPSRAVCRGRRARQAAAPASPAAAWRSHVPLTATRSLPIPTRDGVSGRLPKGPVAAPPSLRGSPAAVGRPSASRPAGRRRRRCTGMTRTWWPRRSSAARTAGGDRRLDRQRGRMPWSWMRGAATASRRSRAEGDDAERRPATTPEMIVGPPEPPTTSSGRCPVEHDRRRHARLRPLPGRDRVRRACRRARRRSARRARARSRPSRC